MALIFDINKKDYVLIDEKIAELNTTLELEKNQNIKDKILSEINTLIEKKLRSESLSLIKIKLDTLKQKIKENGIDNSSVNAAVIQLRNSIEVYKNKYLSDTFRVLSFEQDLDKISTYSQ